MVQGLYRSLSSSPDMVNRRRGGRIFRLGSDTDEACPPRRASFGLVVAGLGEAGPAVTDPATGAAELARDLYRAVTLATRPGLGRGPAVYQKRYIFCTSASSTDVLHRRGFDDRAGRPACSRMSSVKVQL